MVSQSFLILCDDLGNLQAGMPPVCGRITARAVCSPFPPSLFNSVLVELALHSQMYLVYCAVYYLRDLNINFTVNLNVIYNYK